MRLAISQNQLVEPQPALRAFCPRCGEPVLAKCGTFRIHHWAHLKGTDCDSWYEPETQWHRDWKDCFPKYCQEIVMGPRREHRADIRATHHCSGQPYVIELQHSPIEPGEIQLREDFYGQMSLCRKPICLDVGDTIWYLTILRDDGTGEAVSLTRHEFLSLFNESDGRAVPIHWTALNSKSLIYRFGQGNVLIFEKDGGYQIAIYRDRGVSHGRGVIAQKFDSIDAAKAFVEPKMANYIHERSSLKESFPAWLFWDWYRMRHLSTFN